jgi:hypothetical protein
MSMTAHSNSNRRAERRGSRAWLRLRVLMAVVPLLALAPLTACRPHHGRGRYRYVDKPYQGEGARYDDRYDRGYDDPYYDPYGQTYYDQYGRRVIVRPRQ